MYCTTPAVTAWLACCLGRVFTCSGVLLEMLLRPHGFRLLTAVLPNPSSEVRWRLVRYRSQLAVLLLTLLTPYGCTPYPTPLCAPTWRRKFPDWRLRICGLRTRTPDLAGCSLLFGSDHGSDSYLVHPKDPKLIIRYFALRKRNGQWLVAPALGACS